MSFHETLAMMRSNAELSVAEVSARTNLAQSHLWYLERGTHRPRYATVQKLAKGLGLSAGQRLKLYRSAGYAMPTYNSPFYA